MSNKEEEKFFQQREKERHERQRRESELAALAQVEREGIAASLHTDDDVAAEALALGFDAQTARVLPLMPLIQVAWADGSVSGAEESKVLEFAQSRGLQPETAPYRFLKRVLVERPSDLFFERVNRVLMHIVQADPSSWVKKSIPELCKEVAEASGGVLGVFGEKISDEERELIDQLTAQFNAADAQADRLTVYTQE